MGQTEYDKAKVLLITRNPGDAGRIGEMLTGLSDISFDVDQVNHLWGKVMHKILRLKWL